MTFDPSRTFLRLVARRPDGFVELELAVGEPELFVEMILTPAAFDELCARRAVTLLAPRPTPPEPACTSTSAP